MGAHETARRIVREWATAQSACFMAPYPLPSDPLVGVVMEGEVDLEALIERIADALGVKP